MCTSPAEVTAFVINSLGDLDALTTQAIMTPLGNLGQGQGFSVFVNPNNFENADWTEWLWDMTWSQWDSPITTENDNWSREAKLLKLVLACECEWSNEGKVLEDFQKLPLARATLVRLMVYCGDMTNELRAHIQAFQQNAPGDTYLFVAYNMVNGIWRPKYDVIVVDDGHTPNAIVHRLEEMGCHVVTVDGDDAATPTPPPDDSGQITVRVHIIE